MGNIVRGIFKDPVPLHNIIYNFKSNKSYFLIYNIIFNK